MAGPIPALDHIVIVMMENTSASSIYGNTTQAPYLNSLANQYSKASNYFAITHPSLPNYLTVTGGSDFGITSDCSPSACPVNAKNIGDSIEAAGKSWKAYMEDMPSPCATTDSYPYVVKHNPFVYFNNIRTNAVRCTSHDVPFTQLAIDLKSTATTPSYAWITPNMCNDMHDCTINTGDTWLSQQVPTILNSPAFTQQNSALIVLWDEDDFSGTNQVAAIWAGAQVQRAFASSTTYNHYSLLKTVEAAWGLPALTSNDSGATPMSDFFTATTPTPSPSPTPPPPPPPPPSPSTWQTAVSTQQYSLANNNGANWADIDPAKLQLNVAPGSNVTAVLGANADLWTANAGFNQDLGIFVSVNGGADQLVAWKESGGSAGTFSPNAAFVRGVYSVTPGSTYVFKLKWKTNKNADGVTVFAGAGPIAGQYSPTRLTLQLLTATNEFNSASTLQYSLTNSDGISWVEIDPARIGLTMTPTTNATAVLGANADLWTANAGFNQDLGIFVSVNGGADQLVAWKESGGFAGTYSPNAAFVQSVYSVTAGNTYLFKLKWKTSLSSIGATIFAGAGPSAGQYSPTRLSGQLVTSTNVFNSASTLQYNLANNDGTSWVEVDTAKLTVSLAQGSNATAVLGANADLWTANAGYNQDIGIFVSVNGGADQLLAWKESGGFAGTFSPNAAFVQGAYTVSSGNNYTFKLKWKTNKNGIGATTFAGAGQIPGQYSPTRLTAQVVT